MKKKKQRHIPESIENKQQWLWSRRQFFKQIAMAGVATQLTFLDSCIPKESSKPLNSKQFKILKRVQDILFPADDLGPGASDFNSDKYVLWMLNDPRMDPEENEYLINGLDWLEEETEEAYKRSFLSLGITEQENMVDAILETNWGESWLSVNLTYIFEAMISDPIYGFNLQKQGWEWLDHVPGMPRPDSKTMYDAIFETVKSNGQ